MVDESRRSFLGAAPGAALVSAAALAAGVSAARAEDAPTGGTWQRIMDSKTLKIGAAVAEPWFFKDATGSDAPGGVSSNGAVWRGVGPGLAKRLAEEMGVNLEIVETTWGNAPAALQAGQFDLMFLLDGTPQRALAVDFVNTPLAFYTLCLIARDGFNAQTWAELNDPKVRIAVPQGTSVDQFLTRVTPNATFFRPQDTPATYAAFQSGRVDCMVLPTPEADAVVAKVGGHIILVKPTYPIVTVTAVRYEPNNRLKDYLETVVQYFYYNGVTQGVYEEFMAFRGVDPKKVTPLMRELWL
jgi:polar amino acid transport system substrate-binding protein